MARKQRILDRSPEDKARLNAIRDRFQAEKPTREQLVASGEYAEFIPHGEFMNILAILAALKAERQRQGLSLSDIERKTGIDKAALSRLENGHQDNPTFETLRRYAAGLGKQPVHALADNSVRSAK